MKLESFQISDELFLKLGKMITERYGIKMPLDKKVMFQARLQRRLRELDIQSFEEYAAILLNDQGDSTEFDLLADFITTNKTEFFRKMDHFDFISDHFLPDFIKGNQYLPHLRLWSAGCSSGQEAYSIGITIEEYMRKNGVLFDYSILATDISGRMLKVAKEAIYPMSQIDEIPRDIKQLYFLKSKDMKDPKVRVVKGIRDRVRVAYMNLMDGLYPFNTKFDIVFLRNTMIYFNSEVQLDVLTKVIKNLNTGGYLFIGHSESLVNMNLPIKSIAPSVYVKTNSELL